MGGRADSSGHRLRHYSPVTRLYLFSIHISRVWVIIKSPCLKCLVYCCGQKVGGNLRHGWDIPIGEISYQHFSS